MLRLSTSADQAIENTKKICFRLGISYIGTEHIIAGMLSTQCLASKILALASVDRLKYLELLKSISDPNISINGLTPRAKQTFETSSELAAAMNESFIGTEHILIAILMEQDSIAVNLIKRLGVNLSNILRIIEGELNISFNESMSSKISTNDSANSTIFNQPSDTYGGTSQKNENIQSFGIDLNERARQGKLDPVIGRNKEIERVIQILSRRSKNNPVLIGEPGVGKSAVVEGLADKIVKGNVPYLLKDKIIFSLDIGKMVAGTKYRGEFEERLKKFIEQVTANKNIIVFIDELHNLIGAGATGESSMDAAEILKPMLARGEFQTIGATTTAEYRKYIEKDSALERRFMPIIVDEPSIADSIEILNGIKDKYEAHHKISITSEAIEAAVKLSARYISDRFLPDKAIDLIDEAASRARIDTFVAPPNIKELKSKIEILENQLNSAVRKDNFEMAVKLRDERRALEEEISKLEKDWNMQKEKNITQIGEEEIASIVSLWTSIPVQKLTESESEKMLNLEEDLHKRVVGQNEAVESISRAIKRSRAGLKDPKRPIGSFIFVGPTGVGKTELTKALAEVVFGDENAMIRVDMSEFMESHSVSKLIGAPPGYVGFDEAGQLTEKVRRKPYSVILFDEIEKAHPDIFNLMLQILDDGRLTDSRGRTVDFRNTIIVMTSNAGANEIQRVTKLGFGAGNDQDKSELIKDKVMAALKDSFKPEFLNRIDDIIVFEKLKIEDTSEIAQLIIQNITKRLKEKQIEITVSENAKNFLVEKGYSEEYGARPLKRVIQKYIEDGLSEEILKRNLSLNDKVLIDCENGKIIFTKQ